MDFLWPFGQIKLAGIPSLRELSYRLPTVCMNAEAQMTTRHDRMVMNSLHDKDAPFGLSNNSVTLSGHSYDKSRV